MEPEIQAAQEQIVGLWSEWQSVLESLLVPSRLTQVAVILGCIVLAWIVGAWLSPVLRRRMQLLEGWPKWRLRILLIMHGRLRLILIVLFLWMATGVMAQLHAFPSRRYILALVATIATAWLLVVLLARLIRNPLLRRLVTWAMLGYVTLHYLGLMGRFSAFLDGLAVSFGDFHLSVLTILKALIVTGLLFALARTLASSSASRIKQNESISPSMQVLAIKFLQVTLYGAAFFIGIKAAGFDLTGLAVLSGAIGVGLGFGLQKVVSNLVSGVIILLDKSIKPGDVISLGDTFGWINALGARYVSVVTRDGREYLIPNEDLITGQVVNWSHSNDFVRLDIHFGTAYGDDPHHVRRVAIEATKAVDRVLSNQAPVCHIVGFGDSSVDYVLRFWIEDPTGGLTNIRGNVYLALWDAFKDNDISFPFPQREVKLLPGSELSTPPLSGS